MRRDAIARQIEEARLEAEIAVHDLYQPVIEQLEAAIEQQKPGFKRNKLRLEVLNFLKERGKIGTPLRVLREAFGNSVDALLAKLCSADLVSRSTKGDVSLKPAGLKELQRLEAQLYR